MKIGILSDTHDHIENTRKALAVLKEKGAQELIHCGDFCAPFMIGEFDSIGIPIHCVYGNTDDRVSSLRVADNSQHVTLHGDTLDIEFDQKRIIVNHFPKIALAFAESGKYDAVFFGHTHEKLFEKHGDTILVNPGEVMGRKGTKTVALYDTETNDVEFIEF